MEEIRNKLSKAEWLEHISDLCVITLRELQQREDHLTEEDWKLADLCEVIYTHIIFLKKTT